MDIGAVAATAGMLVFPACMILAALCDISTFTIPNRLSVILALAFVPAGILAGFSAGDFGLHLAVGSGALLVGFVLFSFGFIGGGDGKFLAASALWMGWPDVLSFAVAFSIAGGALAVVLILLRGRMLPARLVAIDWVGRLLDGKMGVPYAVALAIGGLFIFPQSELYMRLVQV